MRSDLMWPVFFGLLSKPYVNDKEYINLVIMLNINTKTFISLQRFVGVLHSDPPAPETSPRLVDRRLRSVAKTSLLQSFSFELGTTEDI